MKPVYIYFFITVFSTGLQAKNSVNLSLKHKVKVVSSLCDQNIFLNPVVFYDSGLKTYKLCKTSKSYSKSEIEMHLVNTIQKVNGKFSSRKIASVTRDFPAHFNMKVTFGDKVSQFRLTKDKNIKLQFVSNYGDKKSVVIDKADYNYIQQKIKQLKPPQTNVSSCNQKHITLASMNKKSRRYYAACFDYAQKDAQDLIKLAKIIFALQQI